MAPVLGSGNEPTLDGILMQALQLLQHHLIGDDRLWMTLVLEAAEHRLNGDFTRLQQVIWNLLKNASKFTPEGGLGLGLAISKAIVDCHGGAVRATSPGLGKAAAFIVELPFSTAGLPIQPRRKKR